MLNYRRYQFHDIYEIIIARKVIAKAPSKDRHILQTVELNLLDLYQGRTSLDSLIEELNGRTFDTFDTIAETSSKVLSKLLGIEVEPKTRAVPLTKYYNDTLHCNLRFLRDGDKDWLKPSIRAFTTDTSLSIHRYRVEFTIAELLDSIAHWFESYFAFFSTVESRLKGAVIGSWPTFVKQSELFLARVKEFKKQFGSETVRIALTQWPLRLAVDYTPEVALLHPMNADYRDKALIPLYLEMNGIIDINDFSLTTSPREPAQIDIQWVVTKPCLQNLFDHDSLFLSSDVLRTLSESQIVIIDRIYGELHDALVFDGKPKLRDSLRDLLPWLLTKTAFCLEEPSYLRDKALEYLQKHKGDAYLKAEDGFFLPFIYEKMVDHFGTSRVLKKPEKYKGEIDLLFDSHIPIELKVWKEGGDLLERSVDEMFPHAGQAAAYAAETRVAFLLLLDVSKPDSEITNLENCWKVITKGFDINEGLATKVVAGIFYCNYPSPCRYR